MSIMRVTTTTSTSNPNEYVRPKAGDLVKDDKGNIGIVVEAINSASYARVLFYTSLGCNVTYRNLISLKPFYGSLTIKSEV